MDPYVQLSREYARYKVVKILLSLLRNNRYHVALEMLLLRMASGPRILSQDEVFVRIPITHEYYHDIDRLESKSMRADEIRRLKMKIKTLIDGFISNPPELRPEFSFPNSENAFFRCGDFQKKLPLQIYKALKWRQPEDIRILILILRYECIISRLQQWSLPYVFCRRLYDIGYRVEAASSPLNSMFLVCDMENRNTESRFYSLFPDTDHWFSSLGNAVGFSAEAILGLCGNVGVLAVPPELPEFDHLFNQLQKSGLPFTHISPTSKGMMIRPLEYCVENYSLLDVPIQYLDSRRLYAHMDPELLTILRPRRRSNEQIKIEYRRYKLATWMADYIPNNYEWRNILERMFLNMANLGGVVIDIPSNHWIYETVRAEMKLKRLHVGNTISRIRNDISDFLTRPEDVTIDYWYDDKGFHCNDYTASLGAEKEHMLIRRIGSPDFIEIMLCMLLRYDSCLMRGQHWNVPYTWYEYIAENYGVTFEAFASPINSQLLLVNWFAGGDVDFCSVFPDTDHWFGSLGSVFKLDLVEYMKRTGKTELNVSMALPYVPQIIADAVELAFAWMALPFRIRIFMGAPFWTDADWYKRAEKSEYLHVARVLQPGEYYYENNLDSTVPRIYHTTPFTEFVFSNFPKPDEPSYETGFRSFKHIKY